MRKVVVDASVAVKWFVPEIHSIAAARLLDPEIYLAAPDLITSEFGNILWKKVRRREITRDEASEILTAFDSSGVETHASRGLLHAAFQLAIGLERTVYDSLYLALAVALDCPLITADARFHSAVASSGLGSHILWIEDAV